ncbi:MAG TPA: hypothetical protein VFO94_09605 [Gammaproteobacteria bacterium]|nr:hypothetical protein [Gammaproteobacteria bacterium]
MKCSKWAAAVAAVVAAGWAGAASAQFFPYQLPNKNFVWRWGNENQRTNRRFEDLQASGGEAGFRCDLDAALRPGSQYTTMEVRQMAARLSTAIDFIYQATMLMNDLDSRLELDWATLTCKRPEPTPSTEEEKAEHEQRAREKMQKEIERRRARQQSSGN